MSSEAGREDRVTTVESDPFADLAARTSLYDDTGRLVLVFTLAESTRDDRPWADGAWRPASVPVSLASSAVLAALPGHAFSTSEPALVAALCDAGATELRHAHAMSHSLRVVPDVAADPRIVVEQLTSVQLDRHAERLGELSVAAYPTTHPDHAHDSVGSAVAELRAIARGELLGPYLEQSRVALADGDIVGACLLVDREGVPPDGGPWVIDVFRDPARPLAGVGTALLVGVLAAARSAGFAGLSLAVSHANVKAFNLYHALGFIETGQGWTLVLP